MEQFRRKQPRSGGFTAASESKGAGAPDRVVSAGLPPSFDAGGQERDTTLDM